MTIVLRVVGTPRPQGSKRPVRGPGGRIVLVEGRTKEATELFASWREGIVVAGRQWHADHGYPGPLDGPIAVTYTFRLPRPKSKANRHRHPYPITPPDGDKLERAVNDALTIAALIVDDARIVQWFGRKLYADDVAPGVDVIIAPMADWTTA